MNTIGEHIKSFRKQKNLSQLEIETALDFSPGSLSRIESGKVNPTKETLVKFADHLRLSPLERSKLLNLVSPFPTEEEINSAIMEVREYFSRDDVYGYILDEYFNLYTASNGLMKLLDISSDTLIRAYGKNLLELLINPEYGISKYFDRDYFAEFFALEIMRTKTEVNSTEFLNQLMQNLSRFPEMTEVLEALNKVEKNVLSVNKKIVHMIINGEKLKFHFSREKLKHNQRFEIVEIFNPATY